MDTERLWHIGAKPIVLAHRGGANEAPENSLTAFRQARDKGFRYIETDVHATKDGVAVIFHDEHLDRVSDGTGLISDHTWQELKTVSDESGNHPMRLDEVLEEFPEQIFNVDAKADSVVDPLIVTIGRTAAHKQISLASFSEQRLVQLRRWLPGVASSLGTGAIARLVLAARTPRRVRPVVLAGLPGPDRGVEAIQIPVVYGRVRLAERRLIELAHERGFAVHFWTVNDAATMEQLLDLGADGIITDEPTLAHEIIAARY
ncbi:MAG: glycerophosphodiester phosphodiesterase [Actinomycetaceae bacterium]|nr:glycerophosphodiester phosphodiesterase [Actinomycetaceae bacterium]